MKPVDYRNKLLWEKLEDAAVTIDDNIIKRIANVRNLFIHMFTSKEISAQQFMTILEYENTSNREILLSHLEKMTPFQRRHIFQTCTEKDANISYLIGLLGPWQCEVCTWKRNAKQMVIRNMSSFESKERIHGTWQQAELPKMEKFTLKWHNDTSLLFSDEALSFTYDWDRGPISIQVSVEMNTYNIVTSFRTNNTICIFLKHKIQSVCSTCREEINKFVILQKEVDRKGTVLIENCKASRRLENFKVMWFRQVNSMAVAEQMADLMLSIRDENNQSMKQTKEALVNALKRHFLARAEERNRINNDRLQRIERDRADKSERKWNAFFHTRLDEKLKTMKEYAHLQCSNLENDIF